jgi:hypothetical protein
MGLIDAGTAAKLDRYIGYYEPYFSSHERALDKDKACRKKSRSNVADVPCGEHRRQGAARARLCQTLPVMKK